MFHLFFIGDACWCDSHTFVHSTGLPVGYNAFRAVWGSKQSYWSPSSLVFRLLWCLFSFQSYTFSLFEFLPARLIMSSFLVNGKVVLASYNLLVHSYFLNQNSWPELASFFLLCHILLLRSHKTLKLGLSQRKVLILTMYLDVFRASPCCGWFILMEFFIHGPLFLLSCLAFWGTSSNSSFSPFSVFLPWSPRPIKTGCQFMSTYNPWYLKSFLLSLWR